MIIPEPVVYIVQDPPPMWVRGKPITRDMSSAHRYGNMTFVLGQDDQPSVTPGPCLNRFRKVLKDFRPEHDFICFAGGDPMALALAFLALKEDNHPELQFLQYNRARDLDGERKKGTGYYVPVTVPLKQ